MRPLTIVVCGLALAVVDFRINALDLLPDALGWGLVAFGALRLGMTTPAVLSVATGVASVAGAWLPFRYVWIDPLTGEADPERGAGTDEGLHLRYDDVSDWQLAGMTLAMVLAAVTLWLFLSRCADRAAATGRDGPAASLRLARWLVLATWTAPFVGAVAHAVVYEDGAFDPVWNGRLAYTWLLALATFVWVAVLLLRESDRAWAVAHGTARGRSPVRHGPED